MADSAGAQKISKKDRHTYTPLDGSDQETANVPAGWSGEGKGERNGDESSSLSAEESSSDAESDKDSSSLATGMDKTIVGGESKVKGGGEGNGKEGR